MRRWLFVPVAFVLACGSKTTTTTMNVTFALKPPMPPDKSCLGVVGFEVQIDSLKGKTETVQLLDAPVLDPKQCALKTPIVFDDLDVNAAATITVTGRDGAGTALVGGSGTIDNLLGGAVDLQLAAAGMPGILLVVDRRLFSSGITASNISKMEINTAKGRPEQVLSVAQVDAGEYWNVEPAAYSMQVTALQAGGGSDTTPLTIALTTTTGTLPPAKGVAAWTDLTYYQAQPQ